MNTTWPSPLKTTFTHPFPAVATPPARPSRPTITLPDDVFEQAQLLVQHLSVVNRDQLRLFRQGSRVVRRVVNLDTGQTTLEPVVRATMLSTELSQMFRFRTSKKELASPPDSLLSHLLNAEVGFWQLPSIREVMTMPFFSATGLLVQRDGYHPNEQVWLDAGKLNVPPVSVNPNPAEVEQAKALLEELLQDCLFTDSYSRNNALAAILTPHLRELIDGPIPMHLIAADAPGAGKTTLARLIAQLAQDGPFAPLPEATNEEELRKRFLSVLRTSPRVLVTDNINHRLDSSALANLITAEAFTDRALGGNVVESHLNRVQWILTANRPEISGELRRRTSLIKLGVTGSTPQNRVYRRANVFSWFAERRPELIHAVHTLIQSWVAAGMPRGAVHEHGMARYSEVVGGVLNHVGYGDVLVNMNQLHDQASREEEDFKTLVALWHAKFSTRTVTASELTALMRAHDLYPDGLTSHSPAVVGKRVKYWEGRTAHGMVIRRPFDPSNHRHLLRLEILKIPGATGGTGDTGGVGESVVNAGEPVARGGPGADAPAAPDGL